MRVQQRLAASPISPWLSRCCFPRQLRIAGTILLRRRGHDAGLVPINRAAELREGEPSIFAPGLRPSFAASISSRTHSPVFGKLAHQQFLRRAFVAEGIASSSPQLARCSQSLVWNCSMMALGGLAGSR